MKRLFRPVQQWAYVACRSLSQKAGKGKSQGSTSGVRLETSPIFGRFLVAARDFKAGEVILNESPLLEVPALSKKNPNHTALSSIATKQGVLPIALVQLMAFCTAPASLQKRLLREMYAPQNPKEFIDSQIVSHALRAAEVAASIKSKTAFQVPKDTLAKAALVWSLNSWGTEGGGHALYELGSKLTHSCGERNTFGVVSESRGMHLALRDVRKGETLFTRYYGGMDLLQSTPARQSFLYAVKGFPCKCRRCTSGRDTLRGLICPACHPYARDAATGKLRPLEPGGQQLGLMYCDNAKLQVDDPQPWECNKCHQQFPNDFKTLCGGHERVGNWPVAEAEAALADEAYMSRMLWTPMASNSEEADALRAEVDACLGPYHAASCQLAVRDIARTKERLAQLFNSAAEAMASHPQPCLFLQLDSAAAEEHIQQTSGEVLRIWGWLAMYTDVDPGDLLSEELSSLPPLLVVLARLQYFPPGLVDSRLAAPTQHLLARAASQVAELLLPHLKTRARILRNLPQLGGALKELEGALREAREVLGRPALDGDKFREHMQLAGIVPAAGDPREAARSMPLLEEQLAGMGVDPGELRACISKWLHYGQGPPGQPDAVEGIMAGLAQLASAPKQLTRVVQELTQLKDNTGDDLDR